MVTVFRLVGVVVLFIITITSYPSTFANAIAIDESIITIVNDTCIGPRSSDGLPYGLWRCIEQGRYIESTYKDGYIHGYEITYSSSKKERIITIQSFVHGVKSGISTGYFKNESPHYVSTYENNMIIYQVEFDSLGHLKSEGGYVVDSVLSEFITIDPVTLEIIEVESSKTPQSLKDGIWLFYSNHSIEKKYFYKKDILTDSLILNH